MKSLTMTSPGGRAIVTAHPAGPADREIWNKAEGLPMAISNVSAAGAVIMALRGARARFNDHHYRKFQHRWFTRNKAFTTGDALNGFVLGLARTTPVHVIST